MRLGREEAQRQATSLRAELDEARQVVTADRQKIELQLAQLVQLRPRHRGPDPGPPPARERGRRPCCRARAGEGNAQALSQELGAERDRASALEARVATAEERTVLAQRELSQRDVRIEELLRSAARAGAGSATPPAAAGRPLPAEAARADPADRGARATSCAGSTVRWA